MKRKKLEVVELNKKEEQILIEQHQHPFIKFWKKHNKLFLLILLILALASLITGIVVTLLNLSNSDELIIKEVSIDTDLTIGVSEITMDISSPLSEETAKKLFQNKGKFKSNGEVLLVKTVSKGQFIIKFYSDYTALRIMKNGNTITKIKSPDGKSYGIQENGTTNKDAEIIDITKTDTKKYPWGTVTYFSDGSAEITDSNMDMYVRNANDIKENYISNNKVSYIKEIKNVNGTRLHYYHDGTIEVVKQETSYIVRSEADLNITENEVTFKNNNAAKIMNTIYLDKGWKIDYYEDGGALITKGNQTLSVRKSNSIIIKDNKIYEIVDNNYVTVSKKTDNVTYYTNGSAVVQNYNGETLYVKENSDIKYQNNTITSVGNDYEKLTNERTVDGKKILKFETIAIVETNEYIAIVAKESIVYNTDGSIKEIITKDEEELDDKPIKITNNTNSKIKYRLVIEESKRTTLDSEYVRYQLQAGNKYYDPAKLNKKIWEKDNISDTIKINGTNYILLERTLEPSQTDEIRLMMWIDYDTIPNRMQNTYFYGTIKIYAWQEIEKDI